MDTSQFPAAIIWFWTKIKKKKPDFFSKAHNITFLFYISVNINEYLTPFIAHSISMYYMLKNQGPILTDW